jgi:hypothetical protein
MLADFPHKGRQGKVFGFSEQCKMLTGLVSGSVERKSRINLADSDCPPCFYSSKPESEFQELFLKIATHEYCVNQ